MEGRHSYFVDASYGAIYPALTKLEADGCVTFREETHPGKPARKVYSITDNGRQELFEALCEPPAKDIFKSEFLLIAMCASRLPREVVAKAIAVRERQLEEEIKLVRSIGEGDCEGGTEWVCAYGLTCLSGSLDHLRATRDRLLAVAGSQDSETILTAAE
jgi:DNA-binding PadR family transcriptional regulator